MPPVVQLARGAAICLLALLLGGCLAVPVDQSGGPAAVTVRNTNPQALAQAARAALARYGYAPGPSDFPRWVAFDSRPGRRGQTLGNSNINSAFGDTVVRLRLDFLPIAGTPDYRVVPSLSRVTNAGTSAFERDNRMPGAWLRQFRPALEAMREGAENAGPGGRR